MNLGCHEMYMHIELCFCIINRRAGSLQSYGLQQLSGSCRLRIAQIYMTKLGEGLGISYTVLNVMMVSRSPSHGTC